MTNKSKMLKISSFALVVTGFVLLSGMFSATNAQNRDPFTKAEWAKPKNPTPSSSSNTSNTSKTPSSSTPAKAKPTGPIMVTPPVIEARINYYKRLREEAAAGECNCRK